MRRRGLRAATPVWVDAWVADLLRAREPVTFVAHGGSMWPCLRDGDQVTVAPLHAPDSAPVRVGEVVLLPSERGAGALHRVVWRRRDGALAVAGDALADMDGWFREAQLLGRLVSARRAGRLTSPGGRDAVLWSVLVKLGRAVAGRRRVQRTGHH